MLRQTMRMLLKVKSCPMLPDENERIASTGNGSSTHLPQLLTRAQALDVMMDSMRALQDGMVSIVGALRNAANQGCAGFCKTSPKMPYACKHI